MKPKRDKLAEYIIVSNSNGVNSNNAVNWVYFNICWFQTPTE